MTTGRERQLRLFPHLRFSPYILKRLGEELNPNPDHGLIELVRNAYDADAHSCRIRLENVDRPNGRIEIEDDGIGMNEEGIENYWLVLGRSSKSVDEPTKLGRIPVGSKGLGRLAALLRETLLQVVGAETLVAGQALDERVTEGRDMTRRDPGLQRQDDRGVQADDVVTLGDHRLPPLPLDVLLELDAERAVVPGGLGAAVDLTAGVDETSALGEGDDVVQGGGGGLGHGGSLRSDCSQGERSA